MADRSADDCAREPPQGSGGVETCEFEPLEFSHDQVPRLQAFGGPLQSLSVKTIVRQKCSTTSYMNKAARP